jgi:hypothetical protein
LLRRLFSYVINHGDLQRAVLGALLFSLGSAAAFAQGAATGAATGAAGGAIVGGPAGAAVGAQSLAGLRMTRGRGFARTGLRSIRHIDTIAKYVLVPIFRRAV